MKTSKRLGRKLIDFSWPSDSIKGIQGLLWDFAIIPTIQNVSIRRVVLRDNLFTLYPSSNLFFDSLALAPAFPATGDGSTSYWSGSDVAYDGYDYSESGSS